MTVSKASYEKAMKRREAGYCGCNSNTFYTCFDCKKNLAKIGIVTIFIIGLLAYYLPV